MKTIKVKNGIVHMAESKAVCPFCEKKYTFDELEDKLMKSDKGIFTMTCKCKKRIGIAQDMKGDLVSFKP